MASGEETERKKLRSRFLNGANDDNDHEEKGFGFAKLGVFKGLRASLGDGYVEGWTMELMLG